jgi:hypothetical protein
MIRFKLLGSTQKVENFLNKILRGETYRNVARIAEHGVMTLEMATPKESGETARSWNYEIIQNGSSFTIWWRNEHRVNGFPVAIGLQYGHATGTGGWVAGYDYINPALRPIFDAIAEDVWREVQQA